MTDRTPDPIPVLFRGPPEEFISARDDLAQRLREEGRVDEAKAVKALRRPTVPAWALNQLAERDPEGVAALLASGAELRAAQRATLSSPRNAGRLRDASEKRRRAAGRLGRVASSVLSESGRSSSAHLDEVMAALEAASVDEDAAEHLRAGTFERPALPTAGLGEVFALASVPTGGASHEAAPATKRGRSPAPEPMPRRPDQDSILNAEVARLRRDRDDAVRRLRKDQDLVERLARDRAELQARLQKLEEKLKDARTRVRTDEVEAREAERASNRADGRLARARDSTDRS